MESGIHELRDLFGQLGLPNSAAAIETFVARHRPLGGDIPLPRAPFWTPGQAQFLEEELMRDADWAELIDTLSARLRA
ncbi:hypothetical protein D9M68_627940 [compost metagenome]|uniref:DUF2789 domain-containing protein n=1 Tax=Variovorax boronicumulans TaxID=436515 RepID=UPI000BB3476E|nr:DUF2789 domain-containing protein [Variovorax boronicumulans]PBI95836.1 hypothetical protein BKP43_01440 [Variovorax boronicumulans]